MVYDKLRFNLVETAILKTLAYSDIFNFPLTQEEIWEYLISDKEISRKNFLESLNNLQGKSISKNDIYFCLSGNETIIPQRIKNSKEVSKKMKIAQKAASVISKIPTVLFIGLSGGLANSDVDESDDIDFFIITKKNKLFQTRFWILLFLEFLGVRRRRLDKNPKNKICVNLIIDESQLSFPEYKQDIYIAHEIVKIKPLFEQHNTFSKFLQRNKWVKKYFVNVEFSKKIKSEFLSSSRWNILNFFSFESIAKLLQVYYMKRHIRNETITATSLSFHPVDYRVQTLKSLRLKFQQLGLLTKL